VKHPDDLGIPGGFKDAPLAQELSDSTRRLANVNSAVIPHPQKTRIFAVSNQKGGVGKTTTAVNIAVGLANKGMQVLVIDLDPQGNASTALGIEHRVGTLSTFDVLVNDKSIADVAQLSPESPGVRCVPATIDLAVAELKLYSVLSREHRLKNAIQRYLDTLDTPLDYVFIDCPPSLGLLTINAFTAATEVLIPIQCEYYALEGLSQLKLTIDDIRVQLNPTLELATIILTMYDARTKLNAAVVEDVKSHFPNQTLETLIPRQIGVAEAPGYGQTVINYDRSSTGAIAYMEAAIELANRGARNG
jgi:chromosome partitioning protein